MLILKTKQIGEEKKSHQDDATIAGGELQESPPTSKILPGIWGALGIHVLCSRAGTETKVGRVPGNFFVLPDSGLLENQELAINLQVKS